MLDNYYVCGLSVPEEPDDAWYYQDDNEEHRDDGWEQADTAWAERCDD